jgi:TonB family protein
MMLILQQCTAVDFSGMSNNFSLILTKKRIKMITKNEKAKGLWWRLLATLPVLAILMIANTKVTAQEQQPEKKQINVEIGQFEIFDDNGFPMDLTDTIIYNEDGSYVHFKTTEAPDPMTGEMRSKITATSCNADGTPNENIKFTINAIEKHGDTTMYTVEPFTLDADNFRLSIQTTEDNPVQIIRNNNDSIYQIVEEMPQFPGGEKAMMEYVAKNVKYPQEAKDKEIQGRVFVSFVIEKDGSVNEVKVERGIGGGCDEEAVRVVKAMPKWKPGKQDGKPVRVSYMMPFFFKLEESKTNSNSLVGTTWEGTGTGTKDGVTYTWHSVLQFNSENEGLLIEKLVSQKKNEKPVVEFENVAMDFEYAFDGKKTGAITPKNGDGTYMDELPPEGFILHEDGKTLVLNFYTATDDTGIKFVTYTRR